MMVVLCSGGCGEWVVVGGGVAVDGEAEVA